MGLVRGSAGDAVTAPATQRLLAISWEMPPLSGPRAIQVTRTLAALPEYGWRSRVVCFAPRSNRYHQDHRVSLEELSGGQATRIPVRSPEEQLFFRALWRIVPPLKYFPDEKRVWMPGALRAARAALAAAPADVLVSFAQPWSNHLIALRLARETGLPWVAHFSDPWIDSPYFRARGLARARAASWEGDVIATADRVVFVNVHARDRVMAKYPGSWRTKTAVIPQTYDPDETGSAPARPPDHPMRLVYAGRFYAGIRTPDALLDAMALLNAESPLAGRMLVEFVGADTGEYERRAARLGLDRLTAFPGRMPPREAWARGRSADVLLVIDAPAPQGSLFLPSKLIDYLPLRRPILGITPTAGASAELIRELGYPAVPPDDVPAIAAVLRELLRSHAAGTLAASPQHDSVMARFNIARTTRSFADVLNQARAR
jgi:glycosyltransferase involved in cell wall biosynthesis